MSDGVLIRPYRGSDRPALRRLACETADLGRPVETFFPDRDVFADLVTRYYTDDEPQATWVAEADGRLVGYLTGCCDTARYWRVMLGRIVPPAAGKAVMRGVFCSPRAWRLIGAAIATALRGGWRRKAWLSSYPAHLHVNIQDEFRGREVGRRLVESFCAHAKAVGVAGVYVGVREDNAACRFFEHLGFTLLHRCPLVRWDARGRHLGCTRLYGKRL